MVPLYHGGQ
ncbi:hypothetical protein E2C01_018821 [Portunus trituberculatus]|uniref:Uncharacterized protein n=1 Tax=Portunus trituberculatus TaxID=210409 RepID=A0A5B7DWA8_PORTR|nr:hypothetical protein [Portunus trituberculatus]